MGEPICERFYECGPSWTSDKLICPGGLPCVTKYYVAHNRTEQCAFLAFALIQKFQAKSIQFFNLVTKISNYNNRKNNDVINITSLYCAWKRRRCVFPYKIHIGRLIIGSGYDLSTCLWKSLDNFFPSTSFGNFGHVLISSKLSCTQRLRIKCGRTQHTFAKRLWQSHSAAECVMDYILSTIRT